MPKIPERIGKYEVLSRLGRGGMGTVYLGLDRGLNRQVAIKVLSGPHLDEEDTDDRGVLDRFLLEARSAANLRHPNIVTVYDAGHDAGRPFMAMEYVDGTSLAEIIRRRDVITLNVKLGYIEEICDGLAYAHRNRIVHRDVKPANLMVDHSNVIRILDFGIARVQDSGMTVTGTVIGTYNYMSPEQIDGRSVDSRSDIFSVGAVAYELLAYQQAFPGSVDEGLKHRLCHEDPVALPTLCPGLPGELEELVLRALAKDPTQRFANLEEMRLAIRDIRHGLDPQLELRTIFVPGRGKVSGSSARLRPSSTDGTPSDTGRTPSVRAPGTAAPVEPEATHVSAVASPPLPAPPSRSPFLVPGVVAAAAILLAVLWLTNAAPAPEGANPAPPAATMAAPASDAPAPVAIAPTASEAAPAAAANISEPVASRPVREEAPVRPGAAALDQLLRIDASIRDGDVTAALRLIDTVSDAQYDEQTRAMAKRIAERSMDSMLVADTAAQNYQANEWARAPFSAGLESKVLAERAFARSDYLQALRQALAATSSFRVAERDARTAAAAAAAVRAASPAPASVPSVVPAALPATLAPPVSVPAEHASAPAAAAAAPPKAPELDSAGILGALNSYRSAYGARDVDAIRKIYPSLPRQESDRLRNNFSACKDVNVNFAGLQTAPVAEDPSAAVVTVRSTYFCQPRIKAEAQEVPQDDVFRLRKVNNVWLIDRMGAMDPRR